MIGVSVRRMDDFGLSIRAQYSSITDSELDRVVNEIKIQFPMCGNRQMHGHLLSRGYRIQQSCEQTYLFGSFTPFTLPH